MVNDFGCLNSLLCEDNALDSWLDKEFLFEIADEIVCLNDYVPKDIELQLPDYELRSSFLDNHDFLIDDEFHKKQILDECAADTTWEEHVSIYDEFFTKHPEFFKLIRDEEKYFSWKENKPYYFKV